MQKLDILQQLAGGESSNFKPENLRYAGIRCQRLSLGRCFKPVSLNRRQNFLRHLADGSRTKDWSH